MDNPLFYVLCLVFYVISCFAWYQTGCTITENRIQTRMTKELLEIEFQVQEELRKKMKELMEEL
jgi:hypothetical protein